jgi:hypothetical protein
MQSALLRVYLDRQLRAEIRNGAPGLASRLGLSSHEFDELSGLVCEQSSGLELFAATLARKRDERLAGCYPLLRAHAGRGAWEDWCARFRAHRPVPASPWVADAVAFGDFLAREQTGEAGGIGFIAHELAQYERVKAALRATQPVPPDVVAVRALAAGAKPRLSEQARICLLSSVTVAKFDDRTTPDPLRQLHVLVFRAPDERGVCSIVLGGLLGEVLVAADGTLTVAEILAGRRSLDGSRIDVQVRGALADLARIGVIDAPLATGAP